MIELDTYHSMDYRTENLVEGDRIAERQFALCEQCFWSATVFKTIQNTPINFCPICSNNNISLIPLTIDETYELCVGSKGGLEIKFSKSNI
jgi:hypothetical protein